MEIKQVSNPVVKKVAIVGGGIGGLATAVALRNQGIDAHVYEKARELRPVGAGLSLAPNGLKCLDAIEPGIVEKLKEKGSNIIVQARSVLIGYRIYNPQFSLEDLEEEFGKVSDFVDASSDEFNEWLYSYDPGAIAQKIAANFR